MAPELFTPDSSTSKGNWTPLLTDSIVRVYHSISLLLQDGAVFTGGGGLCGDCAANHFDGQIYTPAYLLKDDGSFRTRHTINTVSPGPFKAGGTVEFTTDSEVTSASIIRYGSTTHTVNTDQRRIAVDLTKNDTDGNKYTFQIPSEPGIALPGYYMLFVLSEDGTPSLSKNVQVFA
jgi:galactose oxidase